MTDAQRARAFVPGHVTAFFAPHDHPDPTRAGSTGAGLTLDQGVTVTVETADDTRIFLNEEPITMDPVSSVLQAIGAKVHVRAETPLALGTGFGVSGAMALGAALAANTALNGSRSENELVTAAHIAEVEAGTGLGDVVAQARGGIPIRLDPGAPAHGRLDGIPRSARLEYLTFGDVPTGEVLAGDTMVIEAAGTAALDRLHETPTLETLFAAAREFARDTDLVTPRIAAVIEEVQSAGGQAAMAMLGETVIALRTGLSDAGYDATTSQIHHGGAFVRP